MKKKAQFRKVFEKDVVPENAIVVDPGTGEEVPVEKIKVHRLVGKEEFYLVFGALVHSLQSEMHINEVKVFAFLVEKYNNAEFSMSMPLKKEICRRTGIKHPHSVNNALKKLSEKPVPMVVELEPRYYRINPRFVFRGPSSERDRQLQAIIELGCENC